MKRILTFPAMQSVYERRGCLISSMQKIRALTELCQEDLRDLLFFCSGTIYAFGQGR
ncbi:hypothetical protein KDA_45320 [Dictyobacter alpinus]|uniref:Uncharacterized protein n=1 Tax=Dictyobacter alpinus TaxID=2014873 RepID=A0A402BCB4_9CHLR|nr:hypothetical protein KDA_45320 [Dictyobacter alpinus]